MIRRPSSALSSVHSYR